MARQLVIVSDELWETIEPLSPEELPKPEGGKPRVDDRAVLTGVIFMLKRLCDTKGMRVKLRGMSRVIPI